MNPVKMPPPINPHWVAENYAETQTDTYDVLPSLLNSHAPEWPVISCWEPDPAELLQIQEAIEKGQPVRIWLTSWTFGYPLQPLQMVAMEPPSDPYTPKEVSHGQS